MKSHIKFKICSLLSLLLISFMVAAPSYAVSYFGQVVAVSDADTIKVSSFGRIIKVRLNGVDSPDKYQTYSQEAIEFTENIALGKRVMVITNDEEMLDWTVADVILSDKTNLGRELIKAGFAWWNIHLFEDKTLQMLEMEARNKKLGLWQDKLALPPWEFSNTANYEKLAKR